MRITPAFFIMILIAGAFILGAVIFLTAYTQRKGQIMNEQIEAISAPEVNGVNDLTITVVYDNNPYKQGLETAWGFACLITGTEKTILFDTGGDGSILLNNMEKLATEPNSVELVVLSHIHGDHTGGLDSFLENNPGVTIYLPKSFPERFKDNAQRYGSKIVEVEKPLKICENVYSTGQLGKLIKEQSLIVRTNKGLVVIAGCAHPGIVKIVNTTKNLLKDDIILPAPVVPAQVTQAQVVMGGFHLEWATKGKLEKIIAAFKKLGVRYACPCHCSGEKARSLFEKHFGRNYIKSGAGKVITLADLQ